MRITDDDIDNIIRAFADCDIDSWAYKFMLRVEKEQERRKLRDQSGGNQDG